MHAKSPNEVMRFDRKRSPSSMGLLGTLCVAMLTGFWSAQASPSPELVTINFNQSGWRDYSLYSEHGFSLRTNVGEVRINNGFPPGSMAAQPSFGFGQGFDSNFTFRHEQHRTFRALSIDLLEASDYPAPFGVTMIGTRADCTVVSQTFKLDGIPGAQTFPFSKDFTNLVALKIAKDSSDEYWIDYVQIDNIQFLVDKSPEVRNRTGISGQCFITATNLTGRTSSAGPIYTAALVMIYDVNSKLVGKCTTNRAGQFRAYLRSGTYTIVAKSMLSPNGPRFQSLPVRVSVYPNQFTGSEVNCATVVR